MAAAVWKSPEYGTRVPDLLLRRIDGMAAQVTPERKVWGGLDLPAVRHQPVNFVGILYTKL